MLNRLFIKHFAIIDELDLTFSNGFTVMTGETGAGKSIIVDAISLLMGAPASEEMISTGETQSVIEGVFTVDPAILAKFAGDYLDDGNELIIVRKITRHKGSEIKVNGLSITLKKLKELVIPIISISGQNEHLRLCDPLFQQYLVDCFATDLPKILARYQSQYQHYLALKNQLNSIEKDRIRKVQECEFLEFQIHDIDQQGFQLGEEAQITAKQKELKYFRIIQESLSTCSEAMDRISVDYTVCKQALEKLSSLDNPLYQAFLQRIQTAQIDGSDLSREISTQASQFEHFDETELDAIESRLDIIFRYKTKYHCTSLDDVISFKNKCITERDQLAALLTNTATLKEQLATIQTELITTAQTIHTIRQKAGKELSELIIMHMKDLHFLHCGFEISVQFYPDALTETGGDQIQFRVSTNAGEPLRALESVASGGELSRILLAVKTVFNKINDVNTIIFDEIDTGIGGLTAIKIGEKIQTIAQSCQVFCVTHLAQIAKSANHHFLISKHVEANKTRTKIQELNPSEKRMELERMIGGESVLAMLTP